MSAMTVVNDTRTLTPTEMVGLAVKGKLDRDARNQLVEAHMSIAEQLALHYSRVSSAEYRELRSEGYLALTEAADSYDPTSGWSFESYARPRIRKAVYAYLGWTGGKMLPPQVRTELRQMKLHRERLEQRLGRGATTEELAAALGCTPKWVCELNILAIEAKSLEAKVKMDEEGAEVGDFIADPSREFDAERQAEIAAAQRKAGYLLEHAKLNPRERRIIEELFGLDATGITHTQEVVAAKLGISHQRVGQLKNEAVKKMAAQPLPPTTPDDEVHHIYGEDEPPAPSRIHHRCYQCGKDIKRWGSSSFKDWTYLAQPWMTDRPGSAPRRWVCWSCSQTEQHRQHLQGSLSARRDQLDRSQAVRMELVDPKTGKNTVAWVYAKDTAKQNKAKTKHSKQQTPMCSICHHDCAGCIADIVVTSTYTTRWGLRYAMKFICTSCYERVGQKWEARKEEAGLVKASPSATSETAPIEPPRLTPRQRAWLALWLSAMKGGNESGARWAFRIAFDASRPTEPYKPQRQSAWERLNTLIATAAKRVETCTAAWRTAMLVEDEGKKAATTKAASRQLILAKSRLGELCQAARPFTPTAKPDEPGYGDRNMVLQGPWFVPESKLAEAACLAAARDAAAKLMLLLPAPARRRMMATS